MKEKSHKLKILGKVFGHTVEFFHKEGFVQLLPVMLGKSVDPLGPDPGSRIVGIPEVEYEGQKFRLVTSMILHKQMAVKHFDRIFIMSPNIRLERSERYATGRHLFEFTQADFEIRDASMDDVLSLIEKCLSFIGDSVATSCSEEFDALGVEPFRFKPPFKRLTTHELEEQYGKDWELSASRDAEQPFWALCHKREFYDKEDPERPGHYLNYDLIYPLGFGEAVSGAEREHEYDRILKRITSDGLDLKAYSSYLSSAKKGLVPSAGAGIGIERLARFLTKSEHIREVSAFDRVPGLSPSI